MKVKLHHFRKNKTIINIIFTIVVIALVFQLLSCEKVTKYLQDDKISGKYAFTLTGVNSYQDTTMIKGMRGTDYPEYSTTYEDVFLYEDGDGNIVGNCKLWKLQGTRDGQDVELDLYIHPQGTVNLEESIDNMQKFTTMNLTLDDFGNLEGDGMYYPYEYYPEIENETYSVSANKIEELSSFEEINTRFCFCDVISSISSFLISCLTDGIFRPIGNCYLHKDGGGYYIFGHEGPGSILPAYTQTVYFPFEWSWCKVRAYHFEISLEGETLTYEVLKTTMEALDKKLENFTSELGFDNLQALFDAMDDFYNEFGGFAISTAYDTHTHNLSIYVNQDSKRDEEAKHHILIQSLVDAFDPQVGTVYVYSGHHIYDSWHLRRSDIGVCNSQLLIMYLFGTNKVNYD